MISCEAVRRAFSYDPDRGLLTWVSPDPDSRGIKGKEVVGTNSSGYVTVTIGRTKYQAHRIIWLYVYEVMPVEFIDHINGIKTDNRLCNLREASRSENGMNSSRAKPGLSGHKNVYPNKGGYFARVKADGKIYQKWFKNLKDAVVHADLLRRKHHAEYRNSGEGKCGS